MMYNFECSIYRECLKELRKWPQQVKRRNPTRIVLKENLKKRIRDPPTAYVSSRQDLYEYLVNERKMLQTLTSVTSSRVRYA